MSISPRVSVVISTYNRAELLMQAVVSVQQQTFNDYEIVIVDNGSTDETPDRLAALGSDIRSLRLPHNRPPSVARNRALALARGEFIAFLDDDDFWQPQKLERQVQLLTEYSECGFAYCNARLRYTDGHLSPAVLKDDQKLTGFIFEPLLIDCFIQTSMVMVRRAAITASGGFDESLNSIEDYELWLRLAYYHQVGYLDESLLFISRHANSHSTRHGLHNYELLVRVLEELPAKLPLNRRQELLRRRKIAWCHAHIGLTLLATDRFGQGRRRLLRSLFLNPIQRHAWLALIGSYRRHRPA